VWHDSFICNSLCSSIHVDLSSRFLGFLPEYTTRLFIREMTVFTRDQYASFMCEMTHSWEIQLFHAWNDSFECVMTHSCVTWLMYLWHDWFIFIHDLTDPCVTWLIYIWQNSYIYDKTHSYMTKLQSFRLLEGEREGDTNRERDALRETDKDTDTHGHTHTHAHTHTHTHTHTCKNMYVSVICTRVILLLSFTHKKFFFSLRGVAIVATNWVLDKRSDPFSKKALWLWAC